MLNEYYKDGIDLDSSESFTKLIGIDSLVSMESLQDYEHKTEMCIIKNILGPNLLNEEGLKYIQNMIKRSSLENALRKVNLKITQSDYTYISVIKERIKYCPIALEVTFGECGWVIILGIHMTGNSANDIAVLYDMDDNKIFLHNLNSLCWMATNSRMIYKEA